MRLSAVVIIMNHAGGVCEPTDSADAGMSTGATAAAGGAVIQVVAEQQQQQQQQQQQHHQPYNPVVHY